MSFVGFFNWLAEVDVLPYFLLLFAAVGVGSLISHFIALIRGSF